MPAIVRTTKAATDVQRTHCARAFARSACRIGLQPTRDHTGLTRRGQLPSPLVTADWGLQPTNPDDVISSPVALADRMPATPDRASDAIWSPIRYRLAPLSRSPREQCSLLRRAFEVLIDWKDLVRVEIDQIAPADPFDRLPTNAQPMLSPLNANPFNEIRDNCRRHLV